MEREVEFGGFSATVTDHEPFARFDGNPILTSEQVNEAWDDPRLHTYTTHNAGIAEITGENGEPEVAMLFRSHIADGRSVIGIARSNGGLTGWRVANRPFLLPATERDEYAEGADIQAIIAAERGGVEDLRANPVGDGNYAFTYSAYSDRVKNKVQVMLATTSDFENIVRHGPIADVDMRNVVIFPRPDANGLWRALFRPNDKELEAAGAAHTGGAFEQICIGEAPTPTGPWRIGRVVMQAGHGPSAFQDKIGPCAPPLETKHGWLSLVHGVRSTMAGNPYVLGVAFHDLQDPERVRMSARPLVMPSAADCRVAETAYVHVPGVVFSCGALLRESGVVVVYYGGNDTVMNVGLSHVDVLNAMCDIYSQDPLTGEHLYEL